MVSDLKKRLEALEAQLKARKAAAAPIRLIDYAIPPARKLIDAKERWRAALCTRRSAKSYSAALWLLDEIRSQKGNVLYVGMEHGQIRKDFYRACVQEIDAKYDLCLKMNESDLSVKSQNGSYLYCLSMDASAAEHRKLRGGKYRLVIVDESQSFKTDLQSLIRDVLQPATADYHGTICLLGTPGTVQEGVWWDITKGSVPGWKVVSWTAYENPHVEWAKEIEDLKKQTPGIEKTTSFRREYGGEWVIDDSDLLYKFEPNRNLYETLPLYGPPGKWHNVLGCDLGWDHPAALVAVSYHDQDPNLYVREVVHGSEWTVTDMAEKIKELNNQYRFERMVADPSWAQSIAELRSRHNLPISAADKPGREAMIELLNDQLILGRIKAKQSSCSQLIHEWKTVNKEDRVKDDAADAFRYAFKDCYQYLAKTPAFQPLPGTAEYGAAEEKRMWSISDKQIKERQLEEAGLTPWPDSL